MVVVTVGDVYCAAVGKTDEEMRVTPTDANGGGVTNVTKSDDIGLNSNSARSKKTHLARRMTMGEETRDKKQPTKTQKNLARRMTMGEDNKRTEQNQPQLAASCAP